MLKKVLLALTVVVWALTGCGDGNSNGDVNDSNVGIDVGNSNKDINDSNAGAGDVVSLTKGLIAYYEFEMNGNDASGNGNSAKEINGIRYSKGIIGKSFDSNASDRTYFNLTKTIDVNKMKSFSFWIYSYGQQHMDDYQMLLSKYEWNIGKQSLLLSVYDNINNINRICVNLYNSVRGSIGFDSVCTYYSDVKGLKENFTVYKNEEEPLMQWTHVVITQDDDYLYAYVNNTLTSKSKKKYSRYTNSTEPVRIGYENDLGGDFTFSYYLNAKIDDLRIYDRLLSKEDVDKLYKLAK